MPKSASSSTVASGTKRKHVTLSIKDKVNLIKKLESGTAVAKLCEEYGLGRYVKSRGQEIAKDDAFEVLHCDDKAPTVCQLTDAEICSMVLMNSNTSVSDSEESEEEIQAEDKMPIDSLVEVLNTAIKGLEQRNFISESDIMAIHKRSY
ncbi:hypothetical protein AVEN_134975-1 [Araneus ventricosus]|uniref:HTH psq-type domain-containing protein n=1 Tax=Araneus ventricosus TaxID=182803 RepID=A0A4Y2CHD2_ARAVE|nr:hypothetical protein AVEN_134975-1 [Araneus ventricosus]